MNDYYETDYINSSKWNTFPTKKLNWYTNEEIVKIFKWDLIDDCKRLYTRKIPKLLFKTVECTHSNDMARYTIIPYLLFPDEDEIFAINQHIEPLYLIFDGEMAKFNSFNFAYYHNPTYFKHRHSETCSEAIVMLLNFLFYPRDYKNLKYYRNLVGDCGNIFLDTSTTRPNAKIKFNHLNYIEGFVGDLKHLEKKYKEYEFYLNKMVRYYQTILSL